MTQTQRSRFRDRYSCTIALYYYRITTMLVSQPVPGVYNMPELMTRAEVASYLGATIYSSYNMAREKKFPPAIQIGKKHMWLKDVVIEWVKTRPLVNAPK
jgi:predicted DNA-binding transcriptional regulator AlpA